MLLTLPNILTLARIGAVPVIVALMYVPWDVARWAALVLYVAAALTDFVDGRMARKRNQISRFGTFLDPIADKVLVLAVMVMLVGQGTIDGIHIVAAIVIALREILISGLREFIAGDRVVIPVTTLAKYKTTAQLIAVAVLLIAPAVGYWLWIVGLVGLWLAATITFYTGYEYMRGGIRHMIARDAQDRADAPDTAGATASEGE